jgi:hypothetical protein
MIGCVEYPDVARKHPFAKAGTHRNRGDDKLKKRDAPKFDQPSHTQAVTDAPPPSFIAVPFEDLKDPTDD